METIDLSELLPDEHYIIVSHVYMTGPDDELLKFLMQNKKKILYIAHPFSYAKKEKSELIIFNAEKKEITHISCFGKWCEVLNYFKDFFTTFFWVIRYGRRQIYIGINNLNAACGIVLRWLGYVDRVVFYTIDYIPQRFSSSILNTIYHAIDRFCVKHADIVWNLSHRMCEARKKRGVPELYDAKQIKVPMGTEDKLVCKPFEERGRYDVVYMGHLREGQGLICLFDAFSQLMKLEERSKLHIYGGGPIEEELKSKRDTLGLETSVIFHGAVSSHNSLLTMISSHMLAVAPYEEGAKNFIQYTDPGKVKAYLSVGLPILVTKSPEVAWELEERKAGFLVDFDSDSIAQAMHMALKDEARLREAIRSSHQMAEEYHWRQVYTRAFTDSKQFIHPARL